MPSSLIIGGPNVLGAGSPLAIDPLFMAARIAMRPLDFSQNGVLLGYYGTAQASGATVSLGAAAHIGSVRWTDTTRFFVLMRVRVGWTVTGAVTLATPMDLQLVKATGFTTDFTTNSTAASLATGQNKMRSNMGTSLLGVNGPRILTTAAMSGQVLTADTVPMNMTSFANQPSGNATVTQAVGVGHQMIDLYNVANQYDHPLVLSANEGALIQPVTAGPVTGTIKYYFEWKWAECLVF